MKLILVESPTKSRTLERFLGKEYKVLASGGHIRDLPKSKLGVDTEKNFEPNYIIPKEKKKTISSLKKEVEKAKEVILSTDPDREGEAISWHLKEALNLSSYKRVTFQEITKSAIEEALKNPGEIKKDLVDAQQARRVLDRLVGYNLSPFLWRKLFRGLSAGRVQSVALKIIVEREREIESFKPQDYWIIDALFKSFSARLSHIEGEKIEKPGITKKEIAKESEEDLKEAKYKILSIKEKEQKRNPPPPFTTSTLQQEAFRRMGYSSSFTMRVAQNLYERGLITYHRTDSLSLSNESRKKAKEVIEKEYGKEFYKERSFKAKGKTQEAHEAIRPTKPGLEEIKGKEAKLYSLIRERFLASQMKEALMKSKEVEIEGKGKKKYLLKSSGVTVSFEGFLKVYSLKFKESYLPDLKEGEDLNLKEVKLEKKETTPPARYSEASLIKILEKNGVGRPSTYAPIISTLLLRGYIEKEKRTLKPTDTALVVTDLLTEHFPSIVDLKFTAKMEDDLDEIARGEKEWTKIIDQFYKPFMENLKKKEKELKKQNILEKTDKDCEECKGKMVIKIGRYGKFLACENYPKCKNTKALEESKEIKEKCPQCKGRMIEKRGRYGTFLGCENYPQCKNTQNNNKKTEVKCPSCNKGEIIGRKNKRGNTFYGCSNYPNCKFLLNKEPVKEKCPECSSLLVKEKKGFSCSNKNCGYKK